MDDSWERDVCPYMTINTTNTNAKLEKREELVLVQMIKLKPVKTIPVTVTTKTLVHVLKKF